MQTNVENEPSCRIQDTLQWFSGTSWQTGWHRVAIVQPGKYERRHHLRSVNRDRLIENMQSVTNIIHVYYERCSAVVWLLISRLPVFANRPLGAEQQCANPCSHCPPGSILQWLLTQYMSKMAVKIVMHVGRRWVRWEIE